MEHTRAGRHIGLCKAFLIGIAITLTILASDPLSAQQAARVQEDTSSIRLTTNTRNAILRDVLVQLRQSYVFPETAKQIELAIRKRITNREYENVTDPTQFAALLTDHLQQVSHDKHLLVYYSRDPIAPTKSLTETDVNLEEKGTMRQTLSTVNFGFRNVAILDGNIGYLDLAGFAPADLGWDTAAAAMTFLSNTDALIIDLRSNTGGTPEMAALLCSYLIDAELRTIHLNDIYWRPDNQVRQYWTLPYVPVRRYANKSIYLLTSAETFSTGEEFAYDLKALKRVTIVGERTSGGAHVGSSQRINEHFAIFVPAGRSINPITKTNWEGVGVAPDMDVSANLAPTTAHLMALTELRNHAAKEQVRGSSIE